MPDKPQTCGQGLAAYAALPEKVGALMDGMAGVLENHTRSLNPSDADATRERHAYDRLVKDERRIASHLRELAAAMRSYRGLPAAPHEPSALADQMSRDAFAAFVRAEESVLAFLEKDAAGHRGMLLALNDG